MSEVGSRFLWMQKKCKIQTTSGKKDMDDNEYFPRGGVRPAAAAFRPSANFLGKPEKVLKKKKGSKKSTGDDGYQSEDLDAEYEQSAKFCSLGLNFSSIKQDMVLLGRVKQILETKVYVSTPGRLEGTVMACHISEPYNSKLQDYVNDKVESIRPLTSMFRRGQYVVLKVLETNPQHLMFSMMPQHIHAGWTHSNIKKGVLLQGAVSSIEDHGYVIDVGIPKATVFLPKNLAHIELDVGQLTWCAVKKISTQPESSVVTVTNKLQSIQESVVKYRESDSRELANVSPGTALEFIVDKALKNGIEGRVFNNTTAYVQRHHAESGRGKKPRLGEKTRARLLYLMPVSKMPFLTMRGVFDTVLPDLDVEQTFQEGQIVDDAKVIAISQRSIILKLGEHDTGLLSVKKLAVDEDLSDEDVLAKSYPFGSEHRVRILTYNLSDYTYSVSNDTALLKEKYFSWGDIRAGQIVDATVHKVNDTSIVLNVGRLVGLVPHMHISDMGVFVDPKKATRAHLAKKKYKVGQSVKARVLIADRDSNKLHLTLKPTFLDPELEIVTNVDQLVEKKSYKGFIKYVDTETRKVLVGFFNNISVLIPKAHLSREPVTNLAEVFHAGQIVNCTVLEVNREKKKVIGSLTFAPSELIDMSKDPKAKKRTSEKEGTNISKKRKEEESTLKANERKDQKKSKITQDNSLEHQHSEVVTTSSESSDAGSKKKSKKQKRISESEASDAIDTDIADGEAQPDPSVYLTPEDLQLINLDDCATHKHVRKRIASLKKSINNRIRRVNVIERKIINLQEKGLNPKNKSTHLAMLSEKEIVEQRMKVLMDALKNAQDKLVELGEDHVERPNYKQKHSVNETVVDETDPSKDNKEVKKSKKVKVEFDNKVRIKEIKVAENVPALELPSVKDFWSLSSRTVAENTKQEVEDESNSSDEDAEEVPKKKRKKLSAAEKVEKLRQEEERIRALERAAALDETRPQSSEQFERLLLANPNSSELWIAYMAFYLQATEIDKARAIGRKALKTINFREEQEKLNVWLAMINFENRFGTKESLEKTLEEALQMNESFKVHSKLLEIYQETSKVPELTALVDLMMKKYKREPTMYISAGNALYKCGLVEKARAVMQKAVSILEKKEHINVIVQFALMERSVASSERAEALLEQIVGAYPQRTDIWIVYVEMLYKAKDIDNIRQVMERAVSHKMPARKMKSLYTKWLEIEERLGNADQVEAIRKKALDFIEKAKF